MAIVQPPRKRFGQHFLTDEAIIDGIVSALQLNTHDRFVEIGPGRGALTLPVLKQIKKLDAVELDRDVIPVFTEKAAPIGDLTIHAVDALEFDFASLKKPGQLLRVFGNLPYNISTPLIFHLLSFSATISSMLFMLQKEVALRLAAAPGSSDYGRLSVMAQYACEMHLLFDVPPSAFYPPPKVQSSMITMVPYAELPYRAQDENLFAQIVKQAFSQRRKMLRQSLKTLVSAADWDKLSIPSNKRPEELSVKEFVEISNTVG